MMHVPRSVVRALAVAVAAMLQATSACSGSVDPVEPPIVEDPDPEPSPPSPDTPSRGEHIYVATAAGVVTSRLTQGTRPAWSPDGRRIAFERGGAVRVIDVDGSGDALLAQGRSPAWSPDGASVAFTTADGISVMPAGGGPARTLVRHDFRGDTYKPSDMGVDKPSWSPDGARIAFEHLGDGEFAPAQVFVMGADGSNPRLLTTSPDRRRYAESDPSWSPNGTQIIHWSFGFGIAVTDRAGGVPATLYAAFPRVAYGTKPVWSRLGVIAFTTDRNPNARPAIWTMLATGAGATQVIADGYDADWSPDAARIAFVSARNAPSTRETQR